MRPKLKIGPLTQLQDARSSAAVGFDVISFSLQRGSMKKLSAAMVWNIVNWIEGPEILLELDINSLQELEESRKMFPADCISLPFADAHMHVDEMAGIDAKIYLLADTGHSPQEIEILLDKLAYQGKEVYVEVSIDRAEELERYSPIADRLFIHFKQSESLEAFLKAGNKNLFGISLGNEFREDDDYLDYEKIDELMEIIQEFFPDE